MIRYIFLLVSAIVISGLVLLVFLLQNEKATLAVGAKLNNTMLGSFDIDAQNSLSTIDNFTWSLSDDGMVNGKSKANIEVVSKDDSNNGVLKVTATVSLGFPFPWAGAAVGDFTQPVEGFDVSGYSKIVFDVKGSSGTYRVLSFAATASAIPPSQNFSVNNEWTTVSLALKEFVGLNTKSLSGFAFVAGPTTGEFEFYLDNIRIE